MKTVEIELADQELGPVNFPFLFLEVFGHKATTIKRLRSGTSNSSDIEGAILQRNNIHLMVCQEGKVAATLNKLTVSLTTNKAKAKFFIGYRWFTN